MARRKNQDKRIVVAMSGGVDSSVSAALLKRAGFDVVGVFMKCWSDKEDKFGYCTAADDERSARAAADKLGIPFYTFDLAQEYKRRVVDYFVQEYAAGRTPNPDVMCNKEIKFGIFFNKAVNELGADYVATGHYARLRREIRNSKSERNYRLLKGKDSNKDQSYFLYRLGQRQLAKTIFPIGEYKKSEVREMARKFGLPNSERKDSQGICFIGQVPVGGFLAQFINDKPGLIVNTKGEGVGEHQGLHYYTVGQRRGVGVGGAPPYYVAAKDKPRNLLIVAHEYDDALLRRDAVLQDVHWIGNQPPLPDNFKVKIRYRQPDQGVRIERINKNDLRLIFNKPQRAVTPGQSAVIYSGQEVLGGGIIA